MSSSEVFSSFFVGDWLHMVANCAIKVAMADCTPSKHHFNDLLNWTFAVLVEIRIDWKCDICFWQVFLRWLSQIREVNYISGTILKSKDKRIDSLVVDAKFIFAYKVRTIRFTGHLAIIDHPWLVLIRLVLSLNTWLSFNSVHFHHTFHYRDEIEASETILSYR